jgi:hypothetical protein
MLVSLILAISVCTINAQNAAKNWIFGQGAWIDFNNGPTAKAVTTINTIEGSSSISNSSGQLLFYTDGRTVWDKNNNPMPHGFGLKGSTSSTHSALIVPCSCDKYLVLTTGDAEHQYADGLQYSVVDINAPSNPGLGDVVTKNVPLLSNASEKVSGVRDASGAGLWVVGHEMGTNKFFSYHIVAGNDCSLNPQAAIISPVGAVYSGGTAGFGQGQMKFSPDGKFLAHAGLSYGPGSFVELFQFNATTGTISNIGTTTARDSLTTNDGFYGIEFSPDSNVLYATTTVANSNTYQYWNITVNKLSSRIKISNFGSGQYTVGALQLAPDGKIYVARRNFPSLYVLNAPNTANGGWTTTPFNLANGTSSQLGLPTVVAGDFSCGPTADVDPCCPPWNPSVLADTLVYQGLGSIAAPYTLKFQPSMAFKSQMQAYIDYLHSVNSNITEITIAWRLHDQTGIGGGWGPQISPTAYAKWTAGGNGNPALWPTTGFFIPPAYPVSPMQVGNSYAVTTGIYLENGQHFFPDTCADVTIFVRIQVTTATTRGGCVLEFSDGKKVIKSVPIGGIKQQQR